VSLPPLPTILNNRSYAILKHELANVGAGDAGRGALDMMELDRPALDWVAFARSMGVEAGRAKTIGELKRQFATGLRSEGPYLIDLVL
jgi:acetolactate synthase-1/2/3 large subunit